jgi:hypothetical protein
MKLNHVSDLDQLVSEYLIFRKCEDASRAFEFREEFKRVSDSVPNNLISVSAKILIAFDEGDYESLLKLWEENIVQPSQESMHDDLIYEVKAAEFLCNLHCAVYPFRLEGIKKAGTPQIAAKTAARSMTIFKKYFESRGIHLYVYTYMYI